MRFSIQDLRAFVEANSPDIQAEVKIEDKGSAVLVFSDIQSQFEIAENGGLVQIRGYLIDKISEVPLHSIGNLSALLLSLNDRFLGCKFTYTENDELGIVCDVFGDAVSTEHVFELCEQMQYVSSSLYPLIVRTLEGGDMPSETEIEEAFKKAD